MTNPLPAFRESDIPNELLENDDLPANDAYIRTLNSIKAQITATTYTMIPQNVAVAKMLYKGTQRKQISEELRISTTKIAKIAARDDVKKLLSQLQYLALALDEPIQAQRTNMLWRIAKRNEEDDARVSISAISEINKMVHNEQVLKQGNVGTGGLNITINNQLLPRGALD